MGQCAGMQGNWAIMRIRVRRLLRSRSGVASLEFALVAIPFFLMVFGIVEFSRLVWTQSAMQFAVEKAARCASVNKSLCDPSTPSLVQTYAQSQMLAPGTTAANFSLDLSKSSCNKVSASLTFTFLLPELLPSSVVLSAQSCYPT